MIKDGSLLNMLIDTVFIVYFGLIFIESMNWLYSFKRFYKTNKPVRSCDNFAHVTKLFSLNNKYVL